MKTHTGIITSLCAVAFAASLFAASPVVRPAPDFSYSGIGGNKSLRNLHGQPVILILTKSPKTKAFRKQLKAIAPLYQEFASRGTVIAAAFSESDGEVESNMPVVVVNNGAASASRYGLTGDFAIAIIGPDGNLDLFTDKVLPAFRIREVIQNSYEVQNSARKVLPSGPPGQ